MIFLTQESDFNLNDENQVMYFYSSWMPFHKKMMFMLNKMEQKYKNVVYYAIDVDLFKGLCVRFNITSIPEIILFKDGKKTKNINGVLLTSALSRVFADIYGN